MKSQKWLITSLIMFLVSLSSCMERNLRDSATVGIHGSIYKIGLIFGAVGAASANDGSLVADPRSFDNVQEAAGFIRKFCPTILSAVRESGCLLYRGEKVVKNKAILLQSESDLHNPEIYGSYAAADYFGAFQNFTLGIFDSGHIGISDTMSASQWGPVASIWPLDDSERGLTYAWLRNNRYFWDEAWAAPQSSELSALGGPFFWRSPNNLNIFLSKKNNLSLNSGLSSALSAGHEVMFANKGSEIASKFRGKDVVPSLTKSSSVYVACPLLLESKLLAALDVEPFTSTIKASEAVPSDPDTYIDNSIYSSDPPVDPKIGVPGVRFRTGYGRAGGGLSVRQYRNQYPQSL